MTDEDRAESFELIKAVLVQQWNPNAGKDDQVMHGVNCQMVALLEDLDNRLKVIELRHQKRGGPTYD